MSEWQKIETAPKDGTPIQVAVNMGKPWGWVRGWSRWFEIRGIGGWVSQGYFEVPGDLGLGNPTHWQPLPPPPLHAREDEMTEDQAKTKWCPFARPDFVASDRSMSGVDCMRCIGSACMAWRFATCAKDSGHCGLAGKQ